MSVSSSSRGEGSNAEPELRVGAIVSLSGPAAEQGNNWLQGAQLAAEELVGEGTAVTLVVEDDMTKPAQASAAFRKLAEISKVHALIGGTWDFLGEAIYPLAQSSKRPLVTPSNPVEIFSAAAQVNPWVFTNGLSMDATEKALLPLVERERPKAAALIVPNVPFGLAHADAVRRALVAHGTSIVMEEHFEYAGYHDTLRGLAAKAKRIGADFILCLTDYGALDVFATELEKLRYFPVIVTTQHLDEAVRLSKKPARYRRAFGIYPQPPSAEFVARFSKRFGVPPKVYAAEGYDALKFLVTALKAKVNFEQRTPRIEYQGEVGHHRLGDSRQLVHASAVILGVAPDGSLVPEKF
jgi:branched-chain amino acid transport system substrate-binding protein